MRNRFFILSVFLVGAVLCFLQPVSAFANVLGNGDFSQPINSGMDNNWDNTNGATRVTTATLPVGGFSALPSAFPNGLAMNSAAGNFTFQVRDNVKKGDFVTFSVLAESSIAPGGGNQGGQIVIEYKQKASNNTDSLTSSSASSFITTGNAPAGGGYQRITVSGVVPDNCNRLVFVLRTFGGAAGDVVMTDASADINPGNMTLQVSRDRVQVGQPILVNAYFKNGAATILSNTKMYITIPKGFSADKTKAYANGHRTEVVDGSMVVSVGDVAPGAVATVNFVAIPTAGITVGKYYEFSFYVKTPDNTISDRAAVQVYVEGDPMFDEGTIIGKVFNDTNGNGTQDEGEKGVPNVQLATEEGILVITDKDGKYHIPAVRPGRHLVKIDGHSLPEGTKFITEGTYLVKTTNGLLNKANFAIQLPPNAIPVEFNEDLTVNISQGLDTTRPKLDVTMKPEVLKVGLEMLEEQPTFKFKMNYPEYVKNWYLDIRDELGQPVWTGFGVGAPPAEVLWSGKAENGYYVKPGLYSYQFKIQDTKGREDWTVLKFFRVLSKTQNMDRDKSEAGVPPVGDFNIFKDGKRSIPLIAKPTVKVQGKTKPENKITVNQQPVPVNSKTGDFQIDMYVTPGEKEYVVEATNPAGESVSYRKTIKVKDSTFFMVALAEEQLGYNFKGNGGETTGEDDTLKKAFYDDGRISYYLRGKLKGKFLFKSSYNSQDPRKELFTKLDPNHYYPVYGDASQISYEGIDSYDRFFVLIEMDRSFIKWGSYETDFKDTELATYNRTMSGLKISHETLGTTPYGDAKRGFKLFWSKAKYRPDHNEFLSTGGSLYYLRNRRLLQGSEKVRVEVRDKIQNIAVQSTDLQAGVDYDISYDEGRIMLTRPLSSVAASDTIVSIDPLDGNPVYLIVDYEYDAGFNVAENRAEGLRGFTHMGDHIRIGATAVQDKRADGNHELRGVDATVKLGRNTKLTAEYAEAQRQQVSQSVSYNGGLSFADESLIDGSKTKTREGAYLFKLESKPVKNLETAGYVQGIEPGFSNDYIKSQEGTRKYGVAAKYKFTDVFYLRYRYDRYQVMDQLLPLNVNDYDAAFTRQQTHTAQAVYDDGKYLGTLEYRRQNTVVPESNLSPILETEAPYKDAIATKLGYRVNEKLLPYVRVQTTIQEKRNYQFGIGMEYKILNNLFAHIEEVFGNLGDATLFGLEQRHEGGSRTYANLKMRDSGYGPQTLSTTIGGSHPITDKSRIYTEREKSTYDGENGYADIIGYQGRAGDHWDYEAKFERRHLKNSTTRLLDNQALLSLLRTNTYNTAYGALGYADGKKFRARGSLEVRSDQDAPKLWQWVSRNAIEYQFNQDLSYLGKLDYGISRFTSPGDYPAAFMEFNNGIAYRPVDNDRLNVLARYAYTQNLGNDIQYANYLDAIQLNEIAHILSADIAYDAMKYLGLVEKLAYKLATLETPDIGQASLVHTFLFAHRFNFHVTRKWDVALEYRLLFENGAASNMRQGPLLEVDREFFEYTRLGVGYNFTNFSDDLRKSASFDSTGPFVRMTGKF